MRRTIGYFLASIGGSAVTIGIFFVFLPSQMKELRRQGGRYFHPISYADKRKASFPASEALGSGKILDAGGMSSFADVVEGVTPSVVHIISQRKRFHEGSARFFRRYFPPFSPRLPEEEGPLLSSGSGVILTSDGYIVTNSHVIHEAEEIEVVLHDNRAYTATLVGEDVSTDLALLRIEERDLPFLVMGRSEQVRIGDWVLAVGNPFRLRATVTAGIVSAKERNVQIVSSRAGRMGIDAFIQTDAEVNMGSSGGALVDLQGELIGINTAIFTQTGNFAGYSFAVPSLLVEKVVKDLMTYGEVRRGILGVEIMDVSAKVAEEYDLSLFRGVFVQNIYPGSAAQEAGMKKGDVIVSLNDTQIQNTAALQKYVAVLHPDDEVELTVVRGAKELTLRVKLKPLPKEEEEESP